MKKRLLCYDEDNPVGVDENGVLSPSALGGGADIVLKSSVFNLGLLDPEGNAREQIEIIKFNYQEVTNKLLNGEIVTAILHNTYVYTDDLVFGHCYNAIDVLNYSSSSIKVDFLYPQGVGVCLLSILLYNDETELTIGTNSEV